MSHFEYHQTLVCRRERGGGREGGRREGGRKGGKKRGRKGRRKGGREEGGREERGRGGGREGETNRQTDTQRPKIISFFLNLSSYNYIKILNFTLSHFHPYSTCTYITYLHVYKNLWLTNTLYGHSWRDGLGDQTSTNGDRQEEQGRGRLVASERGRRDDPLLDAGGEARVGACTEYVQCRSQTEVGHTGMEQRQEHIP